jgi:HK97 gp10 family phage protein
VANDIRPTTKGQTVRVEGLSDLGRNMQALKLDVRFKVAERAARKGAVVFRRKARQLAPKSSEPHQLGVRKDQIAQPGNLKKNIIIRQIKDTNLTAEYEVRVRQGSGKVPNDAFYWLFLEFGTVKMAQRPFMRPAFAAAKSAALEEVKRALGQEIDKSVAKLPNKP